MAGSLADDVTTSFEGFRIGGGDYLVELMATEGQSPASAPAALQHLQLRPRRQGYAIIVAGIVNPIQKFAELRTYEHVFLVQQLRVAKPLEITPLEWEQLLRKAEEVIQRANIETARVGPSPGLLRDARQKKSGRRISPGATVIFLVVLLLAAAVLFRVGWVLMRGH